MSGEICNCIDICVLRFGKGQHNDLCFKTSYRNCEIECVKVTWSGADCFWICFRVCSWKRAYFDSLLISNRKYNDLQSTLNNKIQPHRHSGFYSGMKFEQEWFEVSGFGLVIFLTDIYGTVCVWQGKVIGFVMKL